MGKRKKKTKKAVGVTSGTGKENKKESKDKDENLTEQKFTVDDVLKKVEEYMESFNFELAEKFCTRAIELSPDNLQALDIAASVYLEIGKNDEAVSCLRHAIEIEPGKGFSKFMTLGELLEGEEAAECLKKGIELMITEKETNEKESVSDNGAVNTELNEITIRDISNAFCSLAEVYLTDCCFAEDAESSCKSCCEKAIEQDPDNPDAYQIMANFLLSEQKNEEAKEMLLKGLSLWHGCDDSNIESRMPSYDSRISLSKLLIEVDEFDSACSVLEGLLTEDDEVVQYVEGDCNGEYTVAFKINKDGAHAIMRHVWYLLGWIHYLKEQRYNLVVYYLEMAQKLFTQTGCDDEPLLEHIEEILSEVRDKANEEKPEEVGDELKSMDTTE